MTLCTSLLQVAEAGFYYCGTSKAPDWVRCIVCHTDMDGWEATDDPLYVRHYPHMEGP